MAKRKAPNADMTVQAKDTEEFVLVPRKYLEKLQTTLKEIEGCRYCKGTHGSRAAAKALSDSATCNDSISNRGDEK